LQKSIANPGLQDDLHTALRNNNVPICGIAGAWVWEEGNHPGDGHAILWSGARGRTRAGRGYGVGLYLPDQVQACLRLRDTRAVSDRIFVARFSGTISLTTVVAYVPHAGRPAEERAVFFQQLERELDRVPKMDFQLVLGDFNSSAGKAATTREGGGVLGRHGLGRRNAAGEQLLQFCERSRLSVANTFFRHCAAQKATWRSLTGDATAGSRPAAGLACIDYALVKRQWLSSVRDVRVYRSANRSQLSDHQLLVCTLRLKLKPPTPHCEPPPRLPNREALAEQEYRERFKAAARAAAAEAAAVGGGDEQRDGGAGERWAVLARGLVDAAAASLPPLPTASRVAGKQPFISPATLQLVATRREARRELAACGDPERHAQLALLVRRLAHRVTRSRKHDKSRAVQALAERLAELAKKGNSHGFYAEAKAATGQRAPRAPLLHGATGHGPAAQAVCFAAHFEALQSGGKPLQVRACFIESNHGVVKDVSEAAQLLHVIMAR